ncbi:hypothetical protein ACMU_04120 [Actibacterium mucosum KCTC 23349]|uniref:DUF2029 domain-containing protein n=1 Tax=Actibacterium mucosum KCTC 23349 TaxID=1454373 RepID=A0A037ZGZ8_9RHOB|nr:hypothetical protein [Actibacterium mucosum]KAJ54090.1 hypothetical protein ACMU_04120 [Actibacterium mucosum KCTC 23349]
MNKSQSLKFLAFLFVVLGFYALATLAKGGLFIGNYEGDTAHLLDLSFRLAAGQEPHADYMTPLGVMAYAPISLFLWLGQGAGHAVIYSQLFFALCMIPFVWWAMSSRLSMGWAFFLGFYVIMMVVALSQGQTATHVSLAMHYNRWAWAVAYVAVIVAVLPPAHRQSALADGLTIGLCMSFLALSKATYFIAFAPPVVLALLLRKDSAALAASLATGLAVIAGVTTLAGVGFWQAYLGDMLAVSQSEVRPYPNKPFLDMLRMPNYIGSTLTILIAVIFLRQARQAHMGLMLLVLAPAFFYVTFQNFGNDPQWLILAMVLVLAARPAVGIVNKFGWDLRQALGLTAVALAAFASPAAVNMAFSPKIHYGAEITEHDVFLPTQSRHADLLGKKDRSFELKANIRLDIAEAAPIVASHVPEEEYTILNGEALPACEIFAGAVGFFSSLAEELNTAGYGPEDQILVTDIVNVIWMFGDLTPLKGGAPWYYGGAPGLENANYVLVPTCPYRMSERHRILGVIEDRGIALAEVYRSPAFILLEVGGQPYDTAANTR